MFVKLYYSYVATSYFEFNLNHVFLATSIKKDTDTELLQNITQIDGVWA